ncbi:MAG: GxxExxY protein [Bacteroidetes bacterium]|nr:GxxExxY protein [Bacteroidota bacterium]
MFNKLKKEDLVFPDLSYQIVGCAFEVYNELGFGHAEKYYQKAMAMALKNKGLSFKEQHYAPLKFKGELVGKLFLDFLVEDKVIVELKKNNFYSKANIDQVNEYLLTSKLQLALLINFTSKGATCKRLVNIRESASSGTE